MRVSIPISISICALVIVPGCKSRSGASALREDGSSAESDAPAAAAPDTSFDAAKPLAGVLFGAAGFAPASCFGDAAGTWTTGPAPAYDNPEPVMPGALRFVQADKMTLTGTNWAKNTSGSVQGLDVFDTRADSFQDFVGHFAATGDLTSTNWQWDRAFGRAVTAAFAGLPADRSRYGAVLLRKVLSNQKLAGDAPAPVGVAASHDSYGNCGDGYLTGLVIADNLLVLVAAKDAAARDAAVNGLRDLALQRGNFDTSLDAADRALRTDGAVATSEADGSRVKLTLHSVGEVEAAMNTWRGSATPSGVKSLLGAVQRYTAYPGPDDGVALVNPSLAALAAGRDSLRALAPADRPAMQAQLDALSRGLAACGGLRFEPSCGQLASVTPAVPAPVQATGATYMVSVNGANFTVQSQSLQGDVETLKVTFAPKDDRYFVQPNDPSGATRITAEGGAQIVDAAYPPGVDQDNGNGTWKVVTGTWDATIRVRRPATGAPRLKISAALNNNSSTIPVTTYLPVGGGAAAGDARTTTNNVADFSVTSLGRDGNLAFYRVHVALKNDYYLIHPSDPNVSSGRLNYIGEGDAVRVRAITYPLGTDKEVLAGEHWQILSGNFDTTVIAEFPAGTTSPAVRARGTANNDNNSPLLNLLIPLF